MAESCFRSTLGSSKLDGVDSDADINNGIDNRIDQTVAIDNTISTSLISNDPNSSACYSSNMNNNDPVYYENGREIFEACKNGDMEVVKQRITVGNVNSKDTAGRKSSPLHFAAGRFMLNLLKKNSIIMQKLFSKYVFL